jgi:hypothetical protein
MKNLSIKAGRKAMEILMSEGLNSERISILAGASGGPKWLVLSGIDRVLPQLFRERKTPLKMIGSSIGCFRIAALMQKDPAAAVQKFEESYIEQSYSSKPSAVEVTEESMRIMNYYIEDNAINDILNHPFMRLFFISVKSRLAGESDLRAFQMPYLAAAAASNIISRKLLTLYYKRVLFHDIRDENGFSALKNFSTLRVPQTKENFRKALMSSGSIPLAMSGIYNIPGAPRGVYRDGGVIDYHLDIPFNAGDDSIVLYPHFYSYLVPGWFDKALKWRKPSEANTDNIVLISPGDEFVESLPLKKIPDRKDFYLFRHDDSQRKIYWKIVAEKSREMGKELMGLINSGEIRNRVVPL